MTNRPCICNTWVFTATLANVTWVFTPPKSTVIKTHRPPPHLTAKLLNQGLTFLKIFPGK